MTQDGLSKSVSAILRGPETSYARFGEALASIGDVNLDGFPGNRT